MGTDCQQQCIFCKYDMLSWLEANIALLVRCQRFIYRLHLQEVRHRHCKKKSWQKGEESLL